MFFGQHKDDILYGVCRYHKGVVSLQVLLSRSQPEMRAHFHVFNKVLLSFSVKTKELNRVLAIFTVEDFYILDLQRKCVTVVRGCGEA